jgi:hypothetical protein
MKNICLQKKVKNNKGIKVDIGGLSPEIIEKSPRRPMECKRN